MGFRTLRLGTIQHAQDQLVRRRAWELLPGEHKGQYFSGHEAERAGAAGDTALGKETLPWPGSRQPGSHPCTLAVKFPLP